MDEIALTTRWSASIMWRKDQWPHPTTLFRLQRPRLGGAETSCLVEHPTWSNQWQSGVFPLLIFSISVPGEVLLRMLTLLYCVESLTPYSAKGRLPWSREEAKKLPSWFEQYRNLSPEEIKRQYLQFAGQDRSYPALQAKLYLQGFGYRNTCEAFGELGVDSPFYISHRLSNSGNAEISGRSRTV